jgi:hypothetical protein
MRPVYKPDVFDANKPYDVHYLLEERFNHEAGHFLLAVVTLLVCCACICMLDVLCKQATSLAQSLTRTTSTRTAALSGHSACADGA